MQDRSGSEWRERTVCKRNLKQGGGGLFTIVMAMAVLIFYQNIDRSLELLPTTLCSSLLQHFSFPVQGRGTRSSSSFSLGRTGANGKREPLPVGCAHQQ
eukprot:1156927-Pelagomonas_calceolata.AAC.7